MQRDKTPQEQLSQLFGSYKAEWLKGKLYDLFTEPAYFPELKTARPCMLLGGRGTGKTTVLRCLSYEGQFALGGRKSENITEWSYYGMYYRVNTNRVTAFKGPELSESKWVGLFAHYFNLLLCDLMLRFLDWHYRHCPETEQLGEHACSKIAKSLNLQTTRTVNELADKIDDLRIEFEAYINNVASHPPIPLSAQGAPIDILAEAVMQLPQFTDKNFFFLLDEYENFEDYQQQVVNTLIKHSGQHYSFKIGIRELGWRRRTTLNVNEQLISPADYVRINIVEKLADEKFNDFALAVCNSRIAKLQINNKTVFQDVSKVLSKLSEDEEARELGVHSLVASLKNELASASNKDALSIVDQLPPLQAYFIKFWAIGQNQPIEDMFLDFINNPIEWNDRYNNYKYALLFTLRRGKRGIRKYYAGWETFVRLAANNIRYLLELVDQSLLMHLQNSGTLTQPVTYEIQTIAAQNTGKKNLSELEGLSVHGAKLTKLLLGLGRIFQVMASDLEGHAPEVNQFYLSEEEVTDEVNLEATQLLNAAVMHLALLRFPGSKLTDEGETKDYDYMVHPIFSPFFTFSHRKKRKMKIGSNQLLGLISKPKETIKAILAQNNRMIDEDLPDQLVLFEDYYFGNP